MKNYKIKTATAEYTGGGIYIYYGQLENGLYFRANDGCDTIAICNEDTSDENAEYEEFYIDYMIEELTGDEYVSFFNEMLFYIITYVKHGNFTVSDLAARVILSDTEQRTKKRDIKNTLNDTIENLINQRLNDYNANYKDINPMKIEKISHILDMLTDTIYNIHK